MANWQHVLPRAAKGQSVTEIKLRRGPTITAMKDSALWPHFSDIWYHKSYTKYCTIPRNSLVVDVGANVGVFSLFAASRARVVYSLEPSSSNFSFLVSNTRDTKKIIPLNMACADSDGFGYLNVSTDPVSFSLQKTTTPNNQESVNLISLKTLFERNRIEYCDFLKLDCEGSEFEIILNSESAIMARIRSIVMEYHDHLSVRFSHHDLLKKLSSFGFQTVTYNVKGFYGMIAAIR